MNRTHLGQGRWIVYGLAGGLLMLLMLSEAIAQTPPGGTGSDFTGPNASDNTGIIVDSVIDIIVDPNISDPDGDGTVRVGSDEFKTLVATLSQQLRESQEACAASRVAIPNEPRRFSREPANTPPVETAECVGYRQLVQQVRSFLATLDASQIEEFQRVYSNRVW